MGLWTTSMLVCRLILVTQFFGGRGAHISRKRQLALQQDGLLNSVPHDWVARNGVDARDYQPEPVKNRADPVMRLVVAVGYWSAPQKVLQ